MFVSMHVCTYAYMYVGMCTYVHMYPSMKPSIHPSARPSLHPSIYPSIRACMHACMHDHIRRYTRADRPTYTHAHTHTHIHTYLSLSVAQKCQTPWTSGGLLPRGGCCEHLPSACTPALCSKHSLYEHSLKNTKAPTEHEAQQPEARCTRTYRFPWCQTQRLLRHQDLRPQRKKPRLCIKPSSGYIYIYMIIYIIYIYIYIMLSSYSHIYMYSSAHVCDHRPGNSSSATVSFEFLFPDCTKHNFRHRIYGIRGNLGCTAQNCIRILEIDMSGLPSSHSGHSYT